MPTANEVFKHWIGKDVELVGRPLFASDSCPAIASKGVVIGVLIAYMRDDIGASHVVVDMEDQKCFVCECRHVRLVNRRS
jgi:hypothetical protein